MMTWWLLVLLKLIDFYFVKLSIRLKLSEVVLILGFFPLIHISETLILILDFLWYILIKTYKLEPFLWIHISQLINDHLFYLILKVPIIHRCIAVEILTCTNAIQIKIGNWKTKRLTIWTVEVTRAPRRTGRTETIRDDVRPRAPAGLLPWNSCVVLSRQSCRQNLTWINLKKNTTELMKNDNNKP